MIILNNSILAKENSGQCIKKGKFKQAINILEIKELTSKSEKIQIRVLYNLSTALFLDGQKNQAIKNLKKSLKKYQDKEMKQLLVKMQKS